MPEGARVSAPSFLGKLLERGEIEIMKAKRNILTSLAIFGGIIALFGLAHAQLSPLSLQTVSTARPAPDSIIQLTADSLGLLPVDSPLKSGTFWMMMPNGFSAPYPCPPPGLLPTYSLGVDGEFLVDGTGGQVVLTPRRFGRSAATPTVGSALEFQATSVINLVDMIQGAQLRQMMQSMGVGPPRSTIPPPTLKALWTISFLLPITARTFGCRS